MSAAPSARPAVYFLSDYGRRDEFVGVCHAVVARVAPGVEVIDLTHGIGPFDVRSGSESLVRSVGYLGPGAVLAVVDPGVGGTRRGVIVEVAGPFGLRWLVGPDNGLLVPAARELGGVLGAWALTGSSTFDGRDVFAPAAARLCAGDPPESLGEPVDPSTLVRLPPLLAEVGPGQVRAVVTWVDRYGNVQLAAPGAALEGAARMTPVTVTVGSGEPSVARRVGAFADLDPGGLGVLVDANGRVAVVRREASAAESTGAEPGDLVTLSW